MGGPDHPRKGIAMLYLISGWANNEELGGIEWHVGEALPEIIGRVITFQADGDELECIVNALKATSEPNVQVPTNRDEDGANLHNQLPVLAELNRALDSLTTKRTRQREMIGRRIELLEERMNSIERIFNMEFLEEKE